jgi:DNA-binding NtrC family response regulator
MSLYSIPSLIASLILCFSFFFVISRHDRTPEIKILSCLIISAFIYMLCEFLLINTHDKSTALLIDKIIYIAIPIATALYLNLALVYPKPFNFMRFTSLITVALYLPSLFFILFIPTNYFIAGMQSEYWGWGKIEGPLYNYFRFYLAVFHLACILSFVFKLRNAEPKGKDGILLFIIASLIPAIAIVFVTLVLQPLGVKNLNIMFFSFSIIISLIIVIHTITNKDLLYDMQLLLAPAVKTHKYYFHKKLKALINDIHGVDYKQIVQMLQSVLKCAVGLNVNGKSAAACGGNDAFAQFRLEELEREIFDLQTMGKKGQEELLLLSRATFENFEAIHAQLEACGIEAILPIYDQGQILGTLKFGKGFSEKIYSKQDFQLISALWTQLVVALKYIRKLEEQLSLKDALIEKLNHKIQLQGNDAPALFGGDKPFDDRTVFVSARNDLELPIACAATYTSLRDALNDQDADAFVVDGRIAGAAKKDELARLNKPAVIIGSFRDLPSGPAPRWVDVVAPHRMDKALQPALQSLLSLHRAVRFQVNDSDFITASPKLLTVLSRLQQIAKTAGTILIQGETGTGKELIASYVGQLCNKKIVAVNCAAINGGLFESTFFGHEKGAFTGADQCHRGYLEQSDKAVLFLDEISELPPEMQAKLLRIIEGAPFQRVGGNNFIRPDVQFVCATNRDLKQLVQTGRFREDLLYRLDQIKFELPALNQRREDIALLSGYYLLRFKNLHHVDACIGQAMLERLKSRAWHGNVRELCNAVLKMVLDAKHESASRLLDPSASLPDRIKTFEAALIHDSLKRHPSKTRAAQALGIPFSTLRSKLKKMDFRAPEDPELFNLPVHLNHGASLSEKLSQYEELLISESLKGCETQSEAARMLGIPLSTLRSKLKRHGIEASSASC